MDMKVEAKKIYLIWGSGSPTCFKAMIALEEKGLSGYGNKRIYFEEKGQRGEDVKKLNPRLQVPTFRHGDNIVNESLGICHYLEDVFKNCGTRLIPDDPAIKAKVLQRMHEVDNIHTMAMSDIIHYQIKAGWEESVLLENCKRLKEELKLWEGYLSSTYLAGDQFSMADVTFFPVLALMVRGSLHLDDLPNLKRYYGHLSKRPSIKASWPPHFLLSPPVKMFIKV